MRKLLVLIVAVTVAGVLAVPAIGSATKHVAVCDCLAFKPHKLTIKKGTKVVWTWGGMLQHNVTAISGPQKFHSATMTTGTYSHLFKKKGTYTLECTIHGFMMTVKVH